jgi:hypothetical protein
MYTPAPIQPGFLHQHGTSKHKKASTPRIYSRKAAINEGDASLMVDRQWFRAVEINSENPMEFEMSVDV